MARPLGLIGQVVAPLTLALHASRASRRAAAGRVVVLLSSLSSFGPPSATLRRQSSFQTNERGQAAASKRLQLGPPFCIRSLISNHISCCCVFLLFFFSCFFFFVTRTLKLASRPPGLLKRQSFLLSCWNCGSNRSHNATPAALVDPKGYSEGDKKELARFLRFETRVSLFHLMMDRGGWML